MQKARRRPTKGSDRLQTDGFRFYFTPLFGVLLTFPSRYWSTVGLPGVFSLAGWSPRFRTGFLVSRPTQVAAGGVTRCARPFQTVPVPQDVHLAAPTTPDLPRQVRFGLLPVRSPLLRQSILFFLLLRVLRCFSSPRSPRLLAGDWTPSSRVAPFDTCLRFPVLFRSLPRPSSPPEA